MDVIISSSSSIIYLQMNILPGLMSKWAKWSECIYPSPLATCKRSVLRSDSFIIVPRDDDGLEEVDEEHEGDGEGGSEMTVDELVVVVVVCILLSLSVSRNSAREPPLQYSF